MKKTKINLWMIAFFSVLLLGAGSFVNEYKIGDNTATGNKFITFLKGAGANDPKIGFNPTTNKMFQEIDGNASDLGGGGASPSTYEYLNADSDLAANWTNTGTGTFVISNTSPLAGISSYLFTTAAQNDEVKIAIPVPVRSRGKENAIKFHYTSDLVGMEAYVYDVTNLSEISGSRLVLPVQSSPVDQALLQYFVKDTTANIELRITNTHATNTPTFKFDDVIATDEPLQYKNLLEDKVSFKGNSNGVTNTITATPTAMPFATVEDTNLAWNGSKYFAPVSGYYNISAQIETSGTNILIYYIAIYVNSLQKAVNSATRQSANGAPEMPQVVDRLYLNKGDYVEIVIWSNASAGNITSGTSTTNYVNIVKEREESSNVITPFKTNMTDWTSYTPTFTGAGTASGVQFKYRRVGENVEVLGRFTTGTVTAVQAQLTLPTGLIIGTGVSTELDIGHFARANSTSGTWTILGVDGNSFVTFGVNLNATYNSINSVTGNVAFPSGSPITVRFSVPIVGWSSDAIAMGALPIKRVAKIKVSSLNVVTVSPSLTYKNRNIFGIDNNSDTSFVVLDSVLNKLTLQNGRYLIRIPISGYLNTGWVSVRLLNSVTLSPFLEILNVVHNGSGASVTSHNTAEFLFTITNPITIEVQTKSETSAVGANEGIQDYTIEKIK